MPGQPAKFFTARGDKCDRFARHHIYKDILRPPLERPQSRKEPDNI